jgi:hypothetical protein
MEYQSGIAEEDDFIFDVSPELSSPVYSTSDSRKQPVLSEFVCLQPTPSNSSVSNEFGLLTYQSAEDELDSRRCQSEKTPIIG